MGRSGNNPGFKVYSISTTIRNPKRNAEFLEVLRKFDNKELTGEVKDQIYYELVKSGIYRLTNIDNFIKEKYKTGVQLTDREIFEAIKNNPQKTGDQGRVMTQIRALKEIGLISLHGPRNKKTMQLTELAYDLISGKNVETIYTKAMIGLHANNPQRHAMYNKSRPFLNTLFVIKGLNEYYGNQKGILEHEFGAFVLSMKDCNYKNAINEIINYREKFGNKTNQEYIEDYIFNQLEEIKTDFDNIVSEYTDDVYRKFDMTGLLSTSGYGENKYIRFNEYNIEKIYSILEKYQDYSFISFENLDSYINYLVNIDIPWESSDEVKTQVINKQKELLGVEIDSSKSLDTQIIELDNIYNKRIFDTTIEEYDIELIKKELLLLGKRNNIKSKYDDIPEPVRLEWLIALLTAKTYGSEYVKPNLSLDDKGVPKSFASGGQADIEFVTDNMHCLIEVTLMQDYKQQINSETTSISDHLRQLNTDKEKLSLLIAPRIHNRVAEFFRFTTLNDKLMMLALTIEYYIDLLEEETEVDEFRNVIEKLNNAMCENFIEYCDKINGFKL